MQGGAERSDTAPSDPNNHGKILTLKVDDAITFGMPKYARPKRWQSGLETSICDDHSFPFLRTSSSVTSQYAPAPSSPVRCTFPALSRYVDSCTRPNQVSRGVRLAMLSDLMFGKG